MAWANLETLVIIIKFSVFEAQYRPNQFVNQHLISSGKQKRSKKIPSAFSFALVFLTFVVGAAFVGKRLLESIPRWPHIPINNPIITAECNHYSIEFATLLVEEENTERKKGINKVKIHCWHQVRQCFADQISFFFYINNLKAPSPTQLTII